jgi:Uma2 family endonuclease
MPDLVVEVADTTLAFDLRTKVPLYARSGIPEVWVIDVNERAVHVFREPGSGGFATSFDAPMGRSVASIALHEVSELFPG